MFSFYTTPCILGSIPAVRENTSSLNLGTQRPAERRGQPRSPVASTSFHSETSLSTQTINNRTTTVT